MEASINQIVIPAPKSSVQPGLLKYLTKLPPGFGAQSWAPAWFYSALNWLGKTYYDANNVPQTFNIYMAGSDVDPYAEIGSTRLFLILRAGDQFRLSIAPDADSMAPSTGGDLYPNTDAGIREMYIALADSPIFGNVNFCYVPTRIGPDLDPTAIEPGIAFRSGGLLENGYDPASGLRAVVIGSAVSQVVPLDDFIKTNNEQIYNPSPVIVPLTSALVYALSKYKALGATTFTLPTFYARDRVSAGTDYVNKMSQTVVFGGGPGYDDSAATPLNLIETAQLAFGGHLFTTYDFDKATVHTTGKVGTKVETGIAELTYNSTTPSSVFANQQFLGFYRDNAWTNTNGVPIWDYGTDNARFTAATAAAMSPENIYDPAHGFLSGGTLQNVVRELRRASYLPPYDLPITKLDVKCQSGISYVLAATDKTLTVRGSDGSPTTANIESRDATHTFVGAMVYDASITTVRLFPKLTLSLAVPAVGTHGVLQGETYSARFTYGGKTSAHDLQEHAT